MIGVAGGLRGVVELVEDGAGCWRLGDETAFVGVVERRFRWLALVV